MQVVKGGPPSTPDDIFEQARKAGAQEGTLQVGPGHCYIISLSVQSHCPECLLMFKHIPGVHVMFRTNKHSTKFSAWHPTLPLGRAIVLCSFLGVMLKTWPVQV